MDPTSNTSGEDKKRPNEDAPVSNRPTKRALSSSDSPANALASSTASINTQIPLSEKDQNLLLFQNRAMKIRVEEQKHELGDKEQRIQSLTYKMQVFEETISSLCRVWDQLNGGLQILTCKIDFDSPMDELLKDETTTTTTTTTNTTPNTNGNSHSDSSYQFLTKYITEPLPLDEDYTIEQTLQNRIKKTQSTFSRIAELVYKEHNISSTVFRLLKASKDIKTTDYENLIKEENDRLSKNNQILTNTYDKLQIQIKHLNDQLSHITDQSSSYQQSIKDLQQELDKTVDDLHLERKKLIKMQDDIPKIPTIRLSSPNLSSSTIPNGSISSSSNNITNTPSMGGVGGNSLNSSAQGLNTSNGLPTTPKSESLNGKELSSILQSSDEYIELQKQLEGRLSEARKLREEKANLQKELQQLQFDIRNLPEERILNSLPFILLRQRVQVMGDEIDAKTNHCNKLQHELLQVNTARRTDREAVEQFELNRRTSLERRVAQLEAEAIEEKSEKEKLIEIIDQRNPNVPSQEYLTESRLLLDTKDQDINTLKKECETLKQTIEKYKDTKVEIQRIEEKALKQVELKNLEMKDLYEKLRDLTRLNDELKVHEKKLIDREKELQLSVELLKSSSSDSIDVLELKLENGKLKNELQEIQKQLSQLEELKQQHQKEINVIQEKNKESVRELEVSLAQLKSTEESKKQEMDALMEEIDNLGKEYEKMQEQNTRLMKQLSDKEDTHAHLMSENIKSQQSIRIAREAQLSMEERVIRADEKVKQQNEVVLRLEEKSSNLQKQLGKVGEDLHICNFELEKHKRYVREIGAHSTELKTQLDSLITQNAELKKKNDDSIFALEREIDKAKRLDEERQLLKKKLEKANTNVSPVSNNKAEDELRLINQKLRCTVCNDRLKNHVITKCFHVFCKECIYANLDTRKRKCPSCMGTFSATDVHQIYLT